MSLYRFLTRPQMEAIKAVGVEVISYTIAAPALSSTRVRAVTLSQCPAHPQVTRLGRQKRLHVIHDQLVIPLLILCGSLTGPQEDVWPHAAKQKKNKTH